MTKPEEEVLLACQDMLAVRIQSAELTVEDLREEYGIDGWSPYLYDAEDRLATLREVKVLLDKYHHDSPIALFMALRTLQEAIKHL